VTLEEHHELVSFVSFMDLDDAIMYVCLEDSAVKQAFDEWVLFCVSAAVCTADRNDDLQWSDSGHRIQSASDMHLSGLQHQ
jgi:hypothetical protein